MSPHVWTPLDPATLIPNESHQSACELLANDLPFGFVVTSSTALAFEIRHGSIFQ